MHVFLHAFSPAIHVISDHSDQSSVASILIAIHEGGHDTHHHDSGAHQEENEPHEPHNETDHDDSASLTTKTLPRTVVQLGDSVFATVYDTNRSIALVGSEVRTALLSVRSPDYLVYLATVVLIV
tara:strand:+ start:3467 stop:3841 length:375 start_codon:yes stop_codon:yes gene_type:complete